jgi:hypothetical protein
MVRDSGCIDLAHLLVALTRVGHIHLMHQTSMSYDARKRFGGIGRRKLRSEDPARKATDSRFVLALLPNQVQLV